MNITLDDTSPQLQFINVHPLSAASPGWISNHTDDPMTNRYYRSTFEGTTGEGDYMQFRFNGSAVYVYGAKRNNHGSYSTTLDGLTTTQSGFSAVDQYQALLYSAQGLSSDEHTVVIKNLPSQANMSGTEWWLDIDYVVITTPVTGEVITTRLDDTSPYISYNGNGWTTMTDPQLYYNSTTTVTPVVNRSMTLQFSGSSVAMYGALNRDHGNYTVALDGVRIQDPPSYNGTYFNVQTGVVLYHAAGLVDGPHSITLTNIGQGPGTYFDFDYAIVNSTKMNGVASPQASVTSTRISAPGAAVSTTIIAGSSTLTSIAANVTVTNAAVASGDSNSSSSTTSRTNGGAIAGGVIGGLAILAILGAIFFFMRRRKREQPIGEKIIDLNGGEVAPYTPDSDSFAKHYGSNEAPYLPQPGYSTSPQYEGGYAASAPAPMLRVPPPPPSNAESYPRSVYYLESAPPLPPSETFSYPRSAGQAEDFWNPFNPESYRGSSGQDQQEYLPSAPASQSTVSRSGSTTGSGSGVSSNGNAASLKSALTALPYTSRPANGSIINSVRMQVDGRAMDLGPISDRDGGVDGDHLPPNYEQATEPLPGQRGT